MFLIRRAILDDASTLLKLGKMVHFINLPPDKDIITQKIVHSRNCFIHAATGKKRKDAIKSSSSMGLAAASAGVDLFMFVLEDTETGNCLGTSQLLAEMGGKDNPNISFKLERREYFSSSLQTGTTQILAKYHEDASAPTEIGGLILQPSLRGHKHKLGLFLSMVRFHFIALQRKLFADRVLAEMMAPITPDGQNLFWEAVGRRFIPLSYDEADRFCQYSREFIVSLLPKEDIYLSLLPATARAGVGQVNRETIPARKMLEKLGFQYRDFIDPFDGGPHLEAETNEIPLVRDSRWMDLGGRSAASRCKRSAIVSTLNTDGEFRALQTKFATTADGKLLLPDETIEGLKAVAGSRVGVTPLDGSPPSEHVAKRRVSKKTSKKPSQKTGQKSTKTPPSKKKTKAKP